MKYSSEKHSEAHAVKYSPVFPQYKDCVLESGLRDESSRGEYTTIDREWRIHCIQHKESGENTVSSIKRVEHTLYTALGEWRKHCIQH